MLASDIVRSAPDQAFAAEILGLSKKVMHDVLCICRTKDSSIDRMDPLNLSKIVSLLGLQRDFEDLEVNVSIRPQVGGMLLTYLSSGFSLIFGIVVTD